MQTIRLLGVMFLAFVVLCGTAFAGGVDVTGYTHYDRYWGTSPMPSYVRLGNDMDSVFYAEKLQDKDRITAEVSVYVREKQRVYVHNEMVSVTLLLYPGEQDKVLEAITSVQGEPSLKVRNPNFPSIKYWYLNSTLVVLDGTVLTYHSLALFQRQLDKEGISLSELYPR